MGYRTGHDSNALAPDCRISRSLVGKNSRRVPIRFSHSMGWFQVALIRDAKPDLSIGISRKFLKNSGVRAFPNPFIETTSPSCANGVIITPSATVNILPAANYRYAPNWTTQSSRDFFISVRCSMYSSRFARMASWRRGPLIPAPDLPVSPGDGARSSIPR